MLLPPLPSALNTACLPGYCSRLTRVLQVPSGPAQLLTAQVAEAVMPTLHTSSCWWVPLLTPQLLLAVVRCAAVAAARLLVRVTAASRPRLAYSLQLLKPWLSACMSSPGRTAQHRCVAWR
jgi:hypothetical protein